MNMTPPKTVTVRLDRSDRTKILSASRHLKQAMQRLRQLPVEKIIGVNNVLERKGVHNLLDAINTANVLEEIAEEATITYEED